MINLFPSVGNFDLHVAVMVTALTRSEEPLAKLHPYHPHSRKEHRLRCPQNLQCVLYACRAATSHALALHVQSEVHQKGNVEGYGDEAGDEGVREFVGQVHTFASGDDRPDCYPLV